jgi:pimeloyl-ACP methyl ester carboxylesterase
MLTTATVTSSDGTPLTVEGAGTGTPLLVVPGALAPPILYRPLVTTLAERHRVVLLERRGYGEIGPHPCRMRYQVEDIVAVLDWIGEPAVVFGHSFGAIAVLESARAAGERISALALYEPPLYALGPKLLPVLSQVRTMLSENKRAEAVAAFLGAVTAIPPGEDLAQISALLSARAEGVVSDLECLTSTEPQPEHWAELPVPALLLYGEASDLEGKEGSRRLAELVPSWHLVGLPGQTHFPDMSPLAAVLGGFVDNSFRTANPAT